MKKTTLLLGFVWLMFSCQTEEYEPIATPLSDSFDYEFFSVNLLDIDLYSSAESVSSRGRIPTEELNMAATFRTNIEIPEELIKNRDEQAFEEFINENLESLQAQLIFTINGEIDEVVSISEDTLIESKASRMRINSMMNDYPNRNDCSYTGIQQCTQYAIYEGMNNLEKLFCAYAGLGCILEEAGACISRNCAGDTAPNDPIP